ncbi:hypothetical protein [Sphingomonas oryzagri]
MIKPSDISLAQLRKIGWKNWDPIGLSYPDGSWDEGCADEYDRYLLHIAGSLVGGGNFDDAVTYLDVIASEHMGIGPTTAMGHAASQRTVEAVIAYLNGDAG